MRQQLNTIEFIENYLLGHLAPEEHALAQQRIEDSPELTHLFETQQCIYSATRRKALRDEIIALAPPRPNFFQRNRNWFMGGMGIMAFIVGIFVYSSNSIKKEHDSSSHLMAFSNGKSTEDVTPWIPFDVQSFVFEAENGTTIVGSNGTLILLAENSLRHANGDQVKGKVHAELIEAIDWEDMIAYNLTTTSNGKALSSGGMFRIRYKQNGKEVFVDPERPMHVEIPTDNFNPDMKIWEGEVNNGALNWNYVQDIDRHLNRINLAQLDFIPRGFDAEVASFLPYKGHQHLSSQLIDSMYYAMRSQLDLFGHDREPTSSFVDDCHFNIQYREDVHGHPKDQARPLLKGKNSVTGQIVGPNGEPLAGMEVMFRMDRYLEHDEIIMTDENGYFTFDKFYPGEVSIYASLHSPINKEVLWKYCLATTFVCPKTPKKFTLKKPLVADFSSMVNYDLLSVDPKTGGCFIDPLTIKTLKSSRFQNTFVATKEFEMRLQAMHQLRNGSSILDLYVNHLSEPLWKCDEMAAQRLTGKDRQVFEEFARQRLTNVKDAGIHQQALSSYYREQRLAYKKEQQARIAKYQSQTTTELAALRKQMETTLNNSDELAEHHVATKTIPANTQVIEKRSNRRSTATSGVNYSFSWSSNSWANVDCFGRFLGERSWNIQANSSDDIKILECIRSSQSVLDISVRNQDVHKAWHPRNELREDTYCLGLKKDGGQLYFDFVSYSEQNGQTSTLNLKPISNDAFYTAIHRLSPENSFVAKNIERELALIDAQAKIKAKISPFLSQLNRAKNSISQQVIVYNHLFEFLDRCPTSD